jgi:hypothetical protein
MNLNRVKQAKIIAGHSEVKSAGFGINENHVILFVRKFAAGTGNTRQNGAASPKAGSPARLDQRIWLRNSLVRGSLASSKKVAGVPCSTITPRSVK